LNTSLLIRGGTVVTEEAELPAAVRIDGERIAEVGPGLEPRSGEEVLDATGLLVLPGVIDPHTHFSLDSGTGPTADDWASGSASAAAGGVTTVINFATQHPGQSFQQALDAVHAQAVGRSRIDYGLHLNVTRLDEGWEAELDRVIDRGVTSAKVYTTYKDAVFYVDDWTIYRLMQRSGEAGLLVQMHAENDDMLQGRRRELALAGKTSIAYHGESRPAIAESEAVSRGLFMARATGSPIYFVHLSNPLSVDLVTEARSRGIPAIAETCPHFLCLDDTVYAREDAVRFLMTPPIRPAELVAGMWERVEQGEVHSLGSDHCGYSLAQRGDSSDFRQVGHPGDGDGAPAPLFLRGRSGPHEPDRARAHALRKSGPHLRPLAAQGPACGRCRRRPGSLRSFAARSHHRWGAPQRLRVLAIRRPRTGRPRPDHDPPRAGRL
jgi:dihydropyrimidinase